jgi:glutaredoxin
LVAWADSFGGIEYPLLSDFWPHGQVSRLYGVLRKEGFPRRTIFILDGEGVLRYRKSFKPGFLPENEELFQELQRLQPDLVIPPEPEPTSALPTGGIVMYCTKWCVDCHQARIWLEENKLVATEVDIYDVPGAKKQILEWTGGKVISPVFDIEGTIVIDFDQERLSELLLQDDKTNG